TAPCIKMGPASVSGITKWTVAPEIFTPALSAWPCGSSPGNDGSSDGWMLSILPYQRCTKLAVNNRMNPARQINSIRHSSSVACNAASKPARSLPNGLLSTTAVGTPAALAFSRPAASARFEITTAISAGKSFEAAAAWISAAMFETRPEIRMGTRRFMGSPGKVEMAVVDDAMLARGRNHFAEQGHSFAARAEDRTDRVDRIRADDRDHADAAVEGPQEFELGNAPLLRQPFEDRQHRQTRKIDADAELLRQHARNVVGESAAGDMGEPLHRAGLADRAQARFDVEFGRREQRAAKRHHRREWRRRVEAEPRLRDDLAYQRIAVGMNA